MGILFVHDYDFRHTVGGAELNLRYAYENPPEDINVSFINNKAFVRRRLKGYDKVIVGNSRTLSPNKVTMMVKIFKEEKIPYIKSEHDIMWSDGRVCHELEFSSPLDYKVVGDATKNLWYQPTKTLFENAESVRFLSPKQKILFSAVGIENPNSFIAGSYVDRSIFKNKIPFSERPYDGFCKHGDLWGENRSKQKAKEDGVGIRVMASRGLNLEQMSDYYNSYRYFYDWSILQTTYGRAIIEAHLCGVELRIDPNHAIYSFGTMDDAIDSSQRAVDDFWNGVLNV